MRSIIDKIKNNIIEYSMISHTDSVLVALSGGADSVMLLDVLCELKNEIGFSIGAAHVNHSIRGDDAIQDQNFCESLCKKYGVTFYTETFDIPLISKSLKTSEENAGRIKRYEYFNLLCKNEGFTKIAVAHNMNDSVETVIFNLARGSSLNGLTGIKPVNNNIIRPIYDVSRDEIEIYLSSKNIDYCTDKTNFSVFYTRNKIRNQVIKILKEINPSVVKTIFANTKNIRDDDEYISIQAQKTDCITVSDNDVVIDKQIFDKQHISIKKRILYDAFLKFQGNCNNIESKHIDILLDKLSSGKQYDMPNGILVVSSFDKIIFTDKQSEQFNEISFDVTLDSQIDFADGQKYVFSLAENINLNEPMSLFVDLEKVKNRLTLRTRRDGDCMIPYGMNGKKKLKKLMCELKIPSYKRHTVPVLCDGDEIVAIVPYRVSEKYKVTDETKKVLKIHIQKEK